MGPERAGAECPACGTQGSPIAVRTVVAVTSCALPQRQTLFVCKTRECRLVYFGADGWQVPVAALRQVPSWKGGDVLCFCFGHRADEGESDGAVAALVETIEARVRAGDCACDLRNPSGRCCLAEIRRREPVRA